jgi:TnsA endonuclease-like protein
MSKERKPKRGKGTVTVTKVKIIRGKGGGPIRTIVERGHTKPTGKFTSLKSGRALPWEAIDERHFMWISEIDSRVRTFIAQPFRMEFYLGGGDMVTYFPDFERTMDGAVEIVEIKKTKAEASRDPYYALKLGLARKTCKTMGWTFRIVSADEDILPTRLFENARLIRLEPFG